ncbi:hypothetical protein YC2023_033481 [Brassica napus]
MPSANACKEDIRNLIGVEEIKRHMIKEDDTCIDELQIFGPFAVFALKWGDFCSRISLEGYLLYQKRLKRQMGRCWLYA